MHINQAIKFILPMITTGNMKDIFFMNKYLIGCYIGDVNMPKFQDKIMLVYNFSMNMDFITFEKKLSKNPYFLNDMDYDYEAENIVIYVFNVPKEHLEDYQLVLEGKYSELSNDLKLKILKFWGDEQERSLLHSVLFKGTRIKQYWADKKLNPILYCAEDEYWYLPRLENELFDIEQYQKKI